MNLIAHVSTDYLATSSAAIDTTGADLIVAVACGQSGTFQDNLGNTYIQAVTTSDVTRGASSLYYCYNPTVGSGHTFSVAGGYEAVSVAAFSGIADSPLDATSAANSGGNAVLIIQPGSITPSSDGELIIAGMGGGKTFSTVSVDSGFTVADIEPGVANQNYGSAIAYLFQTTTAAVNPTFTRDQSGESYAVIASFKAASGGSSFSYNGSGVLSVTGSATTSYSPLYLYSGSGSISATGAAVASQIVKYAYAGSGSLLTSGSAATSQTADYAYSASGTVSIVGAAATSSTTHYAYLGSGAITVAGSATVTSGTEFAYTGGGNIAVSGAATSHYAPAYVYSGNPAISVSGTAQNSATYDYTFAGSGSIDVSGAAQTSYTSAFSYVGGGTIRITGSATISSGDISFLSFEAISIGQLLAVATIQAQPNLELTDKYGISTTPRLSIGAISREAN